MAFLSFQVNLEPNMDDVSGPSLPTSEPTFSVPSLPHASDHENEDPRYSGRRVGSYEHDLQSGYTLRWKNMSEMESWMIKEEEKSTVEFSRKEIRPTQDATLWINKYMYVCGRNHSGGKDKYTKKYQWKRKVPVKRTGCPMRLTIKTYPNTSEVLGKLTGEHSHPIGNSNARFTRLRKETRHEIERLLRLGVDPKKVVHKFLYLVYI